MTHTVRSVLVYVYEDLLGDALLKRPFLYALRQAFPKAHITWCAGGGASFFKGPFAPLVKGLLDTVVVHPLGRHVHEFLKPAPFPDKTFDLIIDTQRDVLPTLLLKRVKHKAFLSRTGRFIFSDFKPQSTVTWRGHLSHRLLQLLSVYEGQPVKQKPLPVVDLVPYIKNVQGLFHSNKTYVGLAPGAGGGKKCWPLERFQAIAHFCVNEGLIPVFILGPAEASWVPVLQDACPDALFPLQADPNLLKDPLNTAALGCYLRLSLANDAGVGHLLGLSKTHLISLFGPTDAKKVHPLALNGDILRAQGFGGDAMHNIPETAVRHKIKKFIKES